MFYHTLLCLFRGWYDKSSTTCFLDRTGSTFPLLLLPIHSLWYLCFGHHILCFSLFPFLIVIFLPFNSWYKYFTYHVTFGDPLLSHLIEIIDAYFISIIGDFSRFTWLYPLSHPSQALTSFCHLKNTYENLFSSTIKSPYIMMVLITNLTQMHQIVSNSGIIYYISYPYTP